MTMIYTILIILPICYAQQSFDYNNWVLPSSPRFPVQSQMHAVGYSNETQTFWVLGANQGPKQLISFKNNVITEYNQTYFSENIYAYGQFYTQTNNILWMIDYSGTKFMRFDVNTLEIDYKYNNITFPLTVGAYACLVSTTQYLFVLSRRDSDHHNTVQMFDLINNKWIDNVPFMTTPRSAAAAVIVDGFIYVIGGWNYVSGTHYYLSSFERLYINNASFISSYSWQIVGNLTKGRWGLRAVRYGTDIIVIGGGRGNFDYDVEVYIIDTTTDPLQVRDGGNLRKHAVYAAAIAVEQSIYVFGGRYAIGSTFSGNSDQYQYTMITTFDPTTSEPSTSDPSAAPTTSDPSTAPTTSDPSTSPTTSDPSAAPTTSNPSAAPSTSDPSATPTTSVPSATPTTSSITSTVIVVSDVVSTEEEVVGVVSDKCGNNFVYVIAIGIVLVNVLYL